MADSEDSMTKKGDFIDRVIGEIARKLCSSGWRAVEGNVSVARAIEIMLVRR